MSASKRSALVAITSLTLLGCPTRTTNPPPPPEPLAPPATVPDAPQPTIAMNPPAPDRRIDVYGVVPAPALPTWDEVRSDHPEGATNPPAPLLAVTADGSTCYKEWRDIRGVPPEIGRAGGRILAEGEASTGTQIACPAERVARVLGAQAPQ